MTTTLTVGTRLRSAVGEAELIIVRSPGRPLDLRCAGHPVIGYAEQGGTPGDDGGGRGGETVALGKRYTDEAGELEVLCTKGGAGPLSVDGTPLRVKEATALPTSD